MTRTIVSTQDFQRLEAFKARISEDRRIYKDAYADTYFKYIAPILDDMLEDLEVYIEAVGEESIHDEDLAFDNEEEE